MLDLFYKKINNNEYISNILYKNILSSYPNKIPNNFNINEYNNKVLEKKYQTYYDYFSNMYKAIDNNIKLDKDQIMAILAEEDYSLIIAGAGTGKTTTIVSLVKYLVDIKHIEPEKIAVISYTKKATLELEKRIFIDFNIPASITTFHSLGMMYIRKIFSDRKCLIVDENYKRKIFMEYFEDKLFKDKNKIKEILDIFPLSDNSNFMFSNYFKENYNKYEDYETLFENYKKDKRDKIVNLKQEVDARIDKLINNDDCILTINHEIVKSKAEALIANFLYCNNIPYKYEKIYKDIMDDRRVYKPDFTLDLGGDEIYLEYFGLSDYKPNELYRYNKIRKIKEDYHKAHHTRFISLGCDKNKDIITELKNSLINMGFKLVPKSYEEIFDRLLDNNKSSLVYGFREFLYKNIEVIKTSVNRQNYINIVNNYISTLNDNDKDLTKRQFFYINDFYLYYQKKLYGEKNYKFDFSDMIYYVNKYMESIPKDDDEFKYKYIIIDEYQDISQEKYEFSKKIANLNKAKVIAVGDDWQSIYSFNGSKIDYIYNFEKYFPGAKIFRINNTYRNCQSLINYAGEFIMKNDFQIKKSLKSNKELKNPIKFILFNDGDEYLTLKKLILDIHKRNPNEKILILARTNFMINQIFNDPDFVNEIENKIEIIGYKDIELEGMTIHKSKGLTSDEVILIGLNNKFPSSDKTKFWLKKIFTTQKKYEPIEYAEERRIFYVALTRTKNNVYLLVNKNIANRSRFVNEIYEIINNYQK